MSSFLTVALRNAARGLRVHPLRGKDAFLRDWPNVATTDESRIRAWAEKFPGCNVGVAAGHPDPDASFVVAIVDSDRVSRLRELAGEHAAEWFHTYSVTSGRPDRAHFYYLMTDEVREFGNKKWSEPGVAGNIFETKVHGGQVVAEGSVHPDTGQEYRIVQDLPPIPFPAGLMKLIRDCYGKDNAGPRERVPREKISEGGRHDALVSEAGRVLRVTEMSKPVLTAHLQDFNEQWLEPPLDADEVERIALSCNWPSEPPQPQAVIGSAAKTKGDGKNGLHLSDEDADHLFATREELETAKPLSFFIDGFLPDDGVTAIAAPVCQRKSLIAQNVARSLLTGDPLFGHFKVLRLPTRVLYLVPELTRSSLKQRLEGLGLMEYVGRTLFCRTLNEHGKLWLTDPALRAHLPGSVVFLDTAIRFMRGNENESLSMQMFSDEIFGLLRDGAASVVVLHHSRKTGKDGGELTLDACMRGSGELAAFLTTCWATRLNGDHPYDSPSILKNVKQRDIQTEPFEVKSDRDTGVLTIVNGSLGNATFTKPQNRANKDGKDEARLEFLRKNAHLSDREASAMLKRLKMGRSHQWVHDRREEMELETKGITYNIGGLTVGVDD